MLQASQPRTKAAQQRFRSSCRSPSQMAQAEMPRLQYCSSLGRPNLFAVAPVAKMSEFAFTYNGSGKSHTFDQTEWER